MAGFEEHRSSFVARIHFAIEDFAYSPSSPIWTCESYYYSLWSKEIAIERLVGNRGCNNGKKRGGGRILTEGLRIRRHPCRVVGDGSNRDQLVCKSHVNIAHSPGTEVSEASRSISRSLDTSFSLVFTALVRFYPTPSVSFLLVRRAS